MVVLLGILLILVALYLFLIAPRKKHPDDSALRGWLYAHRGLHDGNVQVPENSMQAFRLAVEHNYGMELDVQLTRDGKLVVHHDENTRRVCGVDQLIRETNYEDLALLPNGERIPLLSELLDMVAGRTPLIVEIKHHGSAWKNAEAAWGFLKDYKGPYCVESFDPVAMKYFRENAPQIVRGQLASGGAWKKTDSLFQHLALKLLWVNVISRPHFVAYSVAHDKNLSMWLMKHLFHPLMAAWTIRDQATLDYAKAEGYHYPIFEKFVPKA